MTKYVPVIAGVTQPNEEFGTTAQCWTYIAELVKQYADTLNGDESLAHVYAEWDMVHSEFRANALAPWPVVLKVEGPEGKWWGVQKGGSDD